MNEHIIITCALTGSASKLVPAVPITPKQIADEALAARAAGASVVHIHVRDPETGAPSMEYRLYEEVVHRIRDAGSDVLIVSMGAPDCSAAKTSRPTRAGPVPTAP